MTEALTTFRSTLVARPTDPLDAKVFDWLADNMGDVIAFERQPRWRPGWNAVVARDGHEQRLYVRGPRGDSYVSPIDMHQEARIHQVFEANGIPAPRVFGMIPDPLCIVMEELPGRIDTATIEDPALRQAVRESFIDIVARIHALPIERFESVGLPVPSTPEEVAMNLYAPSQRIFEQRIAGRRWPLMEFAWSWLKRNIPQGRNRLCFVNFDGGQFLFDEKGRITGLIDFEVSSLGDPAAELAGMRLRDSTEKLGDLTALIRRYESLSGDRIDRKLIEFHTAGFCAVNGFLMWPLMFDSAPEQDYVAYQHYCVATSRFMIRAMADHEGLVLEDPPLPQIDPLGFSQAARHLVRHLEAMPGGDAAARYERDSAAAQAEHLGRVNDYGMSVRAANMADIAALTGGSVRDWDDAQDQLSHWVAAHAGQGDADARLILLFHRWLKRQSFLLRGCGQAAYLTDVDLQSVLHD
ncbi:phosphotransferase [Sphingobium sp.]|uniref:phosphotransferase n=1 Tax=Sphingobium sp. TaxID=1912891 RepID=UPI0025D72B5F|nr:phosphotransferase [Sphingobium sp.]